MINSRELVGNYNILLCRAKRTSSSEWATRKETVKTIEGMTQIKDCRIEQCLNDMQKYEKWGNLLAGQCFVNFFNSNAPVSALTIHNGMEYIKAKMKLSVLQDNRHTDEEKEKRLKQIDIETHQMEEMMKNDLRYRGLMIP